MMSSAAPRRYREHTHITVVTRAVGQRAGIPYELERKLCAVCRRVVDERPLRRAAA
jgi:hypothetical protein